MDFYQEAQNYYQANSRRLSHRLTDWQWGQFVSGFAACMLWAERDDYNVVENPDIDTSAPDYESDWRHFDDMGFSIHDFTEKSARAIFEHCDYLMIHRPASALIFADAQGFEQLGHSLHLSGAGHGAGFFDWNGDIYDRLHDFASRYMRTEGSALYAHGGRVYWHC